MTGETPRASGAAWRALAGFMTVALVVAACGQAGVASPTAGATTAATAATTPTEAPTPEITDVPPDQVTGSLSVLEWGGYDTPDFWIDFKNKYPNVDVGFTFGTTDADIRSQMKAGSPADLFHQYTGWIKLDVDDGLVAPIDTSKLKNWSKVPPAFQQIGQYNGKQYCVAWDWGFTSVLYRTDKVAAPIDTWAALQDPTYKGHISMWDDGPGAVTVSSYIHGWDETQITPDQLSQIKSEWIAQKKLNRTYWESAGDLPPLMKSGEVTVAYAWQGDYATLVGEKVPVAYADPKEGRNSWVGVYCINAKSQNYDLALKFIDEKLSEQTNINLVDEYFYGTANGDVMNGINDPAQAAKYTNSSTGATPELLSKTFSIGDPSILQHTNFTPDVTQAQVDAWTAMWTEVKASQ
jgi:spermidine/putrescine transport system substrate-binding protein